MLANDGKFVVHNMCLQLLLNRALRDSRDKGGLIDQPLFGWVKACAFLVYGDYGRGFSLVSKCTKFDREVGRVCLQWLNTSPA